MALPVEGKIILDTNVYIDYLRAGLHVPWVLGQVHNTVRFLSAVVLLELRLGADTLPRRRAVDRIRSGFVGNRTVAPTPEIYDSAGTLFRSLFPEGGEPADRLGIMNDILIALTARRIGATVVTSNLSDFFKIRTRLPGLLVAGPAAPI
jgi:predicted nucleic acid-binding protein